MSKLKKLLGKRIREIRNSKHWTQEDLSNKTGIGITSLSKIEGGYFHPTDKNLEKIAEALDTEPYILYQYNHLRSKEELSEELKRMIDEGSEEQIKLLYKIVCDIFIAVE